MTNHLTREAIYRRPVNWIRSTAVTVSKKKKGKAKQNVQTPATSTAIVAVASTTQPKQSQVSNKTKTSSPKTYGHCFKFNSEKGCKFQDCRFQHEKPVTKSIEWMKLYDWFVERQVSPSDTFLDGEEFELDGWEIPPPQPVTAVTGGFPFDPGGLLSPTTQEKLSYPTIPVVMDIDSEINAEVDEYVKSINMV